MASFNGGRSRNIERDSKTKSNAVQVYYDRMASALWRPDRVLVYTQGDLDHLPDLKQDIAPLYVAEMNREDESEIGLWLDVHNDAFSRKWGPDEYRAEVLNHPDLQILHTYLVMNDDEVVGTASVGVFRRQKNIGVGHYIQLRRSAQSHGLGKYLLLYRYHKLKQLGIRTCESQTTLVREKALLLHFSCGFRPKTRPDSWNSTGVNSPLARMRANLQLERLYRTWQRGRKSSD